MGETSTAPDNMRNCDFSASAPNVKWLTDITEFQFPAGKVYLSPMIDCLDGMVVSWSIGTRPDAELVNTMLDAAFDEVANNGERPVVHSDRGGHDRWPGRLTRIAHAKLVRSLSLVPREFTCVGQQIQGGASPRDTVRNVRRQLAVLLLTLQVMATSCSAPTIVPNASFEVLYDGPRDEQEIVKDVALALSKNGFAVRGHHRVLPDMHMYAWYAAEPVPGRLAHFVELRYMSSTTPPQRIVFVLFNDRAEVFEEREWRMFFNLRNAVIPKVFPGSAIKTIDHPSAFTASEDLERLQAISLEPLPKADAERLRVYRANARDRVGP